MFNIKKNLHGNELNVIDACFLFDPVQDLSIVIYNLFFVFAVNDIIAPEVCQRRMVVATLLFLFLRAVFGMFIINLYS